MGSSAGKPGNPSALSASNKRNASSNSPHYSQNSMSPIKLEATIVARPFPKSKSAAAVPHQLSGFSRTKQPLEDHMNEASAAGAAESDDGVYPPAAQENQHIQSQQPSAHFISPARPRNSVDLQGLFFGKEYQFVSNSQRSIHIQQQSQQQQHPLRALESLADSTLGGGGVAAGTTKAHYKSHIIPTNQPINKKHQPHKSNSNTNNNFNIGSTTTGVVVVAAAAAGNGLNFSNKFVEEIQPDFKEAASIANSHQYFNNSKAIAVAAAAAGATHTAKPPTTLNLFDNEADLFYKSKGTLARIDEEVKLPKKNIGQLGQSTRAGIGASLSSETIEQLLKNPSDSKDQSATATAGASGKQNKLNNLNSDSAAASSSSTKISESNRRNSQQTTTPQQQQQQQQQQQLHSQQSQQQQQQQQQRTNSPEFKHDVIYVSKTKTTKDSFQKGNVFLTVMDENQRSQNIRLNTEHSNANSAAQLIDAGIMSSKTIADLHRSNISITDFLISEKSEINEKMKKKRLKQDQINSDSSPIQNQLSNQHNSSASGRKSAIALAEVANKQQTAKQMQPVPEQRDLIISYSVDWEIMRKNGFKTGLNS